MTNETIETPDRAYKYENGYRLTTEPLEETLVFDNQGGRSAEKDARLDVLKENAANISNISAIMFDSSFNNSKLDLGELLHDLVSHDRERNFNKTQKKHVVVQKQKNNENEKLTSRGSLKMTKEELHGSLSPRSALLENLDRDKYQKGKATGGSDTARYHTQKEYKTYLQSNYESENRKILSHRDPIEYKRSKENENYSSGRDHPGNKKIQASLEKR